MSITAFIRDEVLVPRLQKNQVPAVYNPDRCYQELCLGMAMDQRVVVDAGESSISPFFMARRDIAMNRF